MTAGVKQKDGVCIIVAMGVCERRLLVAGHSTSTGTGQGFGGDRATRYARTAFVPVAENSKHEPDDA
jgi:hypothetical protein